ncbi:MAG: hypothetical protein PWP67_1775 [Clostridium butyricum]|jgi:hypothetical protein|nr:hypothetical protein [Clostridium butyricum]NOW24054.1 hypothetical protein [Clostridium butyricum]
MKSIIKLIILFFFIYVHIKKKSISSLLLLIFFLIDFFRLLFESKISNINLNLYITLLQLMLLIASIVTYIIKLKSKNR